MMEKCEDERVPQLQLGGQLMVGGAQHPSVEEGVE